MEETSNSIKVSSLTWTRLIKACMLLGCVYLHFTGYEAAMAMLSVFVVAFAFVAIMSQMQFLRGMPEVAISAAMGDQLIHRALLMNNPYSGGMLSLFIVNVIVAYTLMTAQIHLVALLAVLPDLIAFILYGKLSTMMATDYVQQVAQKNLRLQDYMQRRTEIFQDELNKYLKQAEEDTNSRLEATCPELHEEFYSEHTEPVESDQESVSATSKDD